MGTLIGHRMMKSIFIMLLLFCAGYCEAASNKIDPFADQIISCKEMHQYPQQIFEGGIDLGSGNSSPVEVDYQCRGGLKSLPFLKRIDQLANRIRSQDGLQICTGSIVKAHWRYHHFELLGAGIAPTRLLKLKAEREEEEKATALTLEAEGKPRELSQLKKEEAYFAYWANQSPSNHRLYLSFRNELVAVRPRLMAHYQQKFKFSESKASAITTEALSIYTEWAAGSFTGASSFSSTESMKLSLLARYLTGKKVSIARLTDMLAGNPPEDAIQEGLKAALLTHKPMHLLRLLLDRVKTLDQGDETALFFALHNQQNVALLLDKGASVNYTNGFGKTPLFYVVENQDYDMAALLLRRGANPNQAYKSEAELAVDQCAYNITHARRTVLMHAAQHGNVKMMKLLVAHGARLADQDDMGFNALDYAILHRKTANLAYLRSLGGKPNR